MNLPLSAGMMQSAGTEICQVSCNGRIFEGWERVSVVRSIQDMAGRFRLSVTEASSASGKITGWQIRPGDPVKIKLGGVQAINGYVDVRQAAYDAESHGVSIEGRSLTADAVDSSAVKEDGGPVGPYRGYKLDEVARALLQPFGIGLKVVGDVGAVFAMVNVQVGETVFEVIERLARLRGFNLHDDADGNAVLSKQDPKAQSVAGFVEGVNIKRASAVMDVSQVASDLFVSGSAPGDDDASGEDVAAQSAKASNSNAPRHRPKAIVLEQPGDKEDMKVRANREMAQIAADTARVQLTAYGWLKADGGLWAPGDVVHVKSAMLLIDRDMAIHTVEFTQDDSGGTETTLDLVVPESLTDAAPADAPDAGGEEGDSEDGGEDAASDSEVTTAWNVRSAGAAA